jgi:hypothetical protein
MLFQNRERFAILPFMEFSLREAQLYRLLGHIFGPDRIVPRMSVLAVCGGTLPTGIPESWVHWARDSRCLFTIVDAQDEPKLVVQFFSGFHDSVDPLEEEEQKYLPDIFARAGISYATISDREFSDILDPGIAFSLCDCLQSQIEGALVNSPEDEI